MKTPSLLLAILVLAGLGPCPARAEETLTMSGIEFRVHPAILRVRLGESGFSLGVPPGSQALEPLKPPPPGNFYFPWLLTPFARFRAHSYLTEKTPEEALQRSAKIARETGERRRKENPAWRYYELIKTEKFQTASGLHGLAGYFGFPGKTAEDATICKLSFYLGNKQGVVICICAEPYKSPLDVEKTRKLVIDTLKES